jgi:hypothetical protein
MTFTNPAVIESICQQLRLADYPRSLNRARIDSLFNGSPPYSAEEERENNIAINVNSLEGTKLAHDARSQFANAFQKPGAFFTARTDMGPVHKRQKYGTIVTREVYKVMKRSPLYFETLRSKFAMLMLHGIGPSAWETSQMWCPDAIGIEDVMIPSNTLLTMKNIPFFAIFRSKRLMNFVGSLTAPRLIRLGTFRGDSPEMGDTNTLSFLAHMASDVVPGEDGVRRRTITAFMPPTLFRLSILDFYWYNDDKKVSGWNRRIIVDAYGPPGAGVLPTGRWKGLVFYNPQDRKYGSKDSEIVNFQFADLSAVARSVTTFACPWASCYAVCTSNRLRCKFNEAV